MSNVMKAAAPAGGETVYRSFLPETVAWRSVADGGAIAGKEGLAIAFGARQLAAFDGLLASLGDIEPERIARAQFSHPDIDGFLSGVSREIRSGKGVAIMALPVRYSDEELARLFWGVGLHLGVALPQTAAGDLIDHIRDLSYNPSGREMRRTQYNNEELYLHTDNASGEILGLMTLQVAKSGGISRVASSLAMHNEILREHPEYMDALYKGFPYHRKGRQPEGEPDVAPFNTPVFCNYDGVVSCRYVRNFINLAAQSMGVALPGNLAAALDYLDAIKKRPSTGISFTLERGEMLFINNLSCMHARTAFEDHDEPARRRHLLRLWMRALPESRAFDPRMDMFYGSRIDHIVVA